LSVAVLELGDNKLEGQIPVELGNLTRLRVLALNDNLLTGPIPDSFGNLTVLASLDVSQNNLTSTIPASLANLPSLILLDVHNNSLTGPVPAGKYAISLPFHANVAKLMVLKLLGKVVAGNEGKTISHNLGGVRKMLCHYLPLMQMLRSLWQSPETPPCLVCVLKVLGNVVGRDGGNTIFNYLGGVSKML
jgi:hypothetical protein